LIKTADGEIIGNLPMKVNIIPQAMKFFRKKG
jgi:diacylglycerol kinase family enzyme